jgi:hypothetical protein
MHASTPRTDFGKAPAGYVAGLGRGAVGFTTRSDVGGAVKSAGPAGAPPGFAAAARKTAAKAGDYSESNFDKFGGFTEQLFSDTPYDAEDKEADDLYDAIDERMDGRRKKQREAKLKEEMEQYRKTRPQLKEQFRDLKVRCARASYTLPWSHATRTHAHAQTNSLFVWLSAHARILMRRERNRLACLCFASHTHSIHSYTRTHTHIVRG